jgi:DNA polymerase III alpha subunit
VKSVLNDRILWYDGTNQVIPELVPDLLMQGIPPNQIFVTEENEDIKQFNLLCDEQILSNKQDNNFPEREWQIPEEYLNLDIDTYIDQLLKVQFPDNMFYQERINSEMEQIHSRKLESLIKTLIYIVDTFKKSNQVFGVGRGSSCASLVLFLIGIHKVDPVKYNISMYEFFHN